MHLRERTNFIGLSASHKQCRVRGFALAGDTSHRLETRRLGKQTKLFQLGVEMGNPRSTPTKITDGADWGFMYSTSACQLKTMPYAYDGTK